MKPDFPIERVSVKLRGTLEHVYRYLASVKDVSLQLCQGMTLINLFNYLLIDLIYRWSIYLTLTWNIELLLIDNYDKSWHPIIYQ